VRDTGGEMLENNMITAEILMTHWQQLDVCRVGDIDRIY